MRLDEVDKEITQGDLSQLERFADKLFAKVGIDVEFTKHFLDRVNDERNKKQITMSELTRLFKQEFKKWGKPIAQMGPDAEAVMKDLSTDINMPFALRWDRNNQELDLVAKSVMRKPDFKTSNKEFPVESKDDEYEPHMMYKGTKKDYKAKFPTKKKHHDSLMKKGYNHDDPETKRIEEMPIPLSTMYGLVIDGKYVAKGSKEKMRKLQKEKGGTVYNAPGKKVGDSEGKVKESGIMYRAGVKKYGKEGMTKIQSAAGSGASAEEIGAIKDKYNKKKTEGASPHPKGSTKYKKHMAAKHAAMGEKLTISNMRKALDLAEDTDSNTVIAGYVRTMLNEKHNTWNKVTKEIDFVINLLEDTKADRLQVFKLLYKKNIQENEDNKIGLKESIDKLRKIVADKSAMPIRFSDGTMKVDMTTANIFLKAYDRMKESNQIKIQDMMKTKAGFLRVLDFIYGAMK